MSLDGWTFDATSGGTVPPATNSYREDVVSGDSTFTDSSGEAKRLFVVNWENNTNFVNDVLGYAQYTGAGTGVSRVLPDYHPDFPNLWASAVSRDKGYGKTSVNTLQNQSTWTVAKIGTSYREVDYFVADDNNLQPNELYRFVSRKVLAKGDYLQLATNAFNWTIAGGNLGVTPGIIVPSKTLEYTWHTVPSKTGGGNPNQLLTPPTGNTISALLGCYNTQIFDSNYAIGTVLFTAATAELIPPRYNNLYHWTIKYIFEVKDIGNAPGATPFARIGVNWLYRPAGMAWDLPVCNGSYLYPGNDLNQLFILSATS